MEAVIQEAAWFRREGRTGGGNSLVKVLKVRFEGSQERTKEERRKRATLGRKNMSEAMGNI